jgi:hypothetical protein
MGTIRPRTIVLVSASLVALAAATSCEIEYRRYPTLFAGLTPLRVPLRSERIRASFTAVWSEPHYVALVVRNNVDPEVDSLIDRLASSVGSASQNVEQLDFDWRVLSAGIELGRGTGRERPTGAFYGGEAGLQFGRFLAKADRIYELEVRQGAELGVLARAEPTIEVGVDSPGPSLGLRWVKDLNRPLAVALTLVALAFFAGALSTVRN